MQINERIPAGVGAVSGAVRATSSPLALHTLEG